MKKLLAYLYYAESLSDQLEKSGLVSKKKVKQIAQEKRPKNQQQQKLNKLEAEKIDSN
ncbi:MAG: DUF2058 domain-containing protein [Proteobacteria bacterium]|nr:DUF2058 domain-containing protein [Pseudomonadota bacterium]